MNCAARGFTVVHFNNRTAAVGQQNSSVVIKAAAAEVWQNRDFKQAVFPAFGYAVFRDFHRKIRIAQFVFQRYLYAVLGEIVNKPAPFFGF